MTSESNKLLPELIPKERIGTKRRPNRRDYVERGVPLDLPDESPSMTLRRATLKVGQAALINQQQMITDMNPESSLRSSLTVLADPHKDSLSDSDWETVTSSPPPLNEVEERWIEDSFIAKVSGMDMKRVKDARVAKSSRVDVQAFAKKVRTVKGKGKKLKVSTRKGRVSPPLASPSRAAAAADAADAAAAEAAAAAAAKEPAPAPPFMQPGITVEMTPAQAALALTTRQTGTQVTMDDLKTVIEVDDNQDTYNWTVGSIHTGELTLAEAALILTNMQAGTNLTMQDLRTAREMVDLWDNEDVFQWTVGNIA